LVYISGGKREYVIVVIDEQLGIFAEIITYRYFENKKNGKEKANKIM
jgi:hypothetical protein